jgi:cyclase
MNNVRFIARLDVKGENLIKGVHLEGLRKLGPPADFATRYYKNGIDELIYMDVVASLYGRNNLLDIVRKTAENVFIPITVGGGIRSVEDALKVLRAGADKIAINTAATKRHAMITELAERFGSQSIVLSVEASKCHEGNGWEVYTENGREKTGLDVISWVRQAASLGVGEILLTSVDREGTLRGFDEKLVTAVVDSVNIPVIASGGMGCIEDFETVVKSAGADAVAAAHVLHYEKLSISEIKLVAAQRGIPIRPVSS